MIEISQLTNASQDVFEDIKKLTLQFHSKLSEDEVTYDQLEELVADRTALLFIAKEDGHVVGMAILFVLARIGDLSGYVDSVVVDEQHQGKGIATQLMQTLINAAKERHLKRLELTSRSSREAANHLYQKLGFVIRETNPYRLDL